MINGFVAQRALARRQVGRGAAIRLLRTFKNVGPTPPKTAYRFLVIAVRHDHAVVLRLINHRYDIHMAASVPVWGQDKGIWNRLLPGSTQVLVFYRVAGGPGITLWPVSLSHSNGEG